MSQEQPIATHAQKGRRQIKVRIDQLKRSPQLARFGIPELIGLAGAALLLFITLFAYFYFLVPAKLQERGTNSERDRLLHQLQALRGNMGDYESTQERVKKISESIVDFENNRLTARAPGRLSLYTELNEVIRRNDLRNTAGPTYAALDPIGTKKAADFSGSAQSLAKWQTIYPGIAVSVTVEGQYQNIRHFLRDIETSREFLIINAVELEGLTQTGVPQETFPRETSARLQPPTRPGTRAPAPLPVPAAAPPGTRTSLVSLRVEMARYFKRTGTETPAP